jgi:hypothetical protein
MDVLGYGLWRVRVSGSKSVHCLTRCIVSMQSVSQAVGEEDCQATVADAPCPCVPTDFLAGHPHLNRADQGGLAIDRPTLLAPALRDSDGSRGLHKNVEEPRRGFPGRDLRT